MATNLSTKLLDVIARSWTDPDYKARLIANPASVLAEDGIEAPNGASVRVIDQQPNEMYLFLPPRPQSEISIRNVASQAAESAGLTIAQLTDRQSAYLTRSTAFLTEQQSAYLTRSAAPLTEQAAPLTESQTQPQTAPLTGQHAAPQSAFLTVAPSAPVAPAPTAPPSPKPSEK